MWTFTQELVVIIHILFNPTRQHMYFSSEIEKKKDWMKKDQVNSSGEIKTALVFVLISSYRMMKSK